MCLSTNSITLHTHFEGHTSTGLGREWWFVHAWYTYVHVHGTRKPEVFLRNSGVDQKRTSEGVFLVKANESNKNVINKGGEEEEKRMQQKETGHTGQLRCRSLWHWTLPFRRLAKMAKKRKLSRRELVCCFYALKGSDGLKGTWVATLFFEIWLFGKKWSAPGNK